MKNSIPVGFVCGRWVVGAFFFFSLIVPFSKAEFIDAQEFGATYLVLPGGTSTPSLDAYDANTDTYTLVNDTFGASSEHGAEVYPFPNVINGPALVNDIKGTFFLTARVNETSFLGGSYVWIGESASLGIPTNSVILSGTLLSTGYFSFYSAIQSLGTIDVVNPSFANLAGPADRLLITDVPGGLNFWDVSPWGTSFFKSHSAPIAGPSLWAAAPVPEPETYALMLAGFTLLGFVMCRRKRHFKMRMAN